MQSSCCLFFYTIIYFNRVSDFPKYASFFEQKIGNSNFQNFTLLTLMDMIFYIISVLKHSLITATLKPPDPNLPIGPFRPFNTFGMLLLDLEPKIFPGTYTTLVKMVKKCMVVQYLYLVQWMVNCFAEKILLHWNIFQIQIFCVPNFASK